MVCVPTGNVSLANCIPIRHPRSRPASRVAGDARTLLAALEVHRNGKHRSGLNLVVDGIRIHDLARGYADRRLSIELELGKSRRVDAADTSLSTSGQCEGGSCDGQRAGAKGVRELDPESLSAYCHAEGLAESCALELAASCLFASSRVSDQAF